MKLHRQQQPLRGAFKPAPASSIACSQYIWSSIYLAIYIYMAVII
jgi:hypothetical protein